MKLITALMLLFAFQVEAKQLKLDCQIAMNNTIKVDLDTETRQLNAVDRFGTKWDGTTNYAYGSYQRTEVYFLATGFRSGIEMQLQRDGDVILCYEPESCTRCRTRE